MMLKTLTNSLTVIDDFVKIINIQFLGGLI